VVRLLLGRDGAADISFVATVDETAEAAGVAVNVGRAAGLVDTSVLRLVVVELDGIGLGSGGLRTLGGDEGCNGLGSRLLLGGNLRDSALHKRVEIDLALSLSLDLGEDHVDIGGGEGLVEEPNFLAHLAEMGVVHVVGRLSAAEARERLECHLKFGHG